MGRLRTRAASSPRQLPLTARPRGRRRRGPPQRRARRSRPSRSPRRPHQLGPAVAAHRPLGSADAPRAPRPARSCACTSARRARRRRRLPTRRRDAVGALFFALRDVRGGRLALLEDPGAVPRHQDLPSRGRHRLGGRPHRPARPLLPLPLDVRHVAATSSMSPSEVLKRNFWFCAIDDPSAYMHTRPHRRRATSWSSPTTRTATRRGPTRRRSCDRAARRVSRRRHPQSRGRTRRSCFRHPVPPEVRRPIQTAFSVTLAELVAGHAATIPDGLAFVDEAERMTWRDYDERSDRHRGPPRGGGVTRPATAWCPDARRPGVHAAFVACEKAGLVVVGIGGRAGCARGRRTSWPGPARAALHHRVEPPGGGARRLPRAIRLGADDAVLPQLDVGHDRPAQVVMHDQNRWFAFHELAVAARRRSPPDDVFLSVLPAPFGFGLWTAHFTPDDPRRAVRRHAAVRRRRTCSPRSSEHRVTVLAAVSTQFVMMLNSPGARATTTSRRCA